MPPAGDDRKCLFIGDFVSNSNAELEDIFPESDYLNAVGEAYPDVDLEFTPEEQAMDSVVDKVTALFERKNVPFQKWRPAAILRDRINTSPESVDDSVLDTVEQIFTTLNWLFNVTDE